jgi:hypothetical protein
VTTEQQRCDEREGCSENSAIKAIFQTEARIASLTTYHDLAVRAPAIASAIPPAISTTLMIGDTRSL